MNSTQEELVAALRTSLKENERLKRENREYLAAATEPVQLVAFGERFSDSLEAFGKYADKLTRGE